VSDAISVDEFHRFFTDKVEAVCAATADGLPPTFTAAPVASSFTGFHKVTVNDVISAICRLPDKSCVADTLPTPQLKLVADLIDPFLTQLFNRYFVNSHCTDSVQVGAHHAIDQEARPRLCRSTVLQADFQFIGGVQASRAYRFTAALQLLVCGRPSAMPAVCISDTSLYRDGRAESTDGHSVCSR